MEHDNPLFIQCAHEAYERGIPLELIEYECHLCKDAHPADECLEVVVTYPTALAS